MDSQEDAGEEVLIATLEKNKKEEVRISVKNFKGRNLINFRVFYKDSDGTMKPGKQGLAINVEHYKELAGAIIEVGKHLKTVGLV